MDLKNKKLCNRCNSIYNVGPFENMNAAGTLTYSRIKLTYSRIKLYDFELDLCPACTKAVYDFIIKGGN